MIESRRDHQHNNIRLFSYHNEKKYTKESVDTELTALPYERATCSRKRAQQFNSLTRDTHRSKVWEASDARAFGSIFHQTVQLRMSKKDNNSHLNNNMWSRE